MNVSTCSLWRYFLLRFWSLSLYCTWTSCCSLYDLLDWSWSVNFSHQLLTLFLCFLVIFIDFFFRRSLLLLMLWLSLIKITIKLISSWTTLNIIFLVVVTIFKITKIVLTLSSPKGILLFLFFPTDQIIHFCPPSISKLHISHSQIFRINLRCWWFLFIIFVRAILKIWVFFRPLLAVFLITIFFRKMLFFIGMHFLFLDGSCTSFSWLTLFNRLLSHKYNDSAISHKSNPSTSTYNHPFSPYNFVTTKYFLHSESTQLWYVLLEVYHQEDRTEF